MNPTGKRARKAKGLTKAEIKHSNHTPKSEAKTNSEISRVLSEDAL